jgi:hypothetical protein
MIENGDMQVPIHIRSRQPSYFIIAGLVFTAVSEALLQYGSSFLSILELKN